MGTPDVQLIRPDEAYLASYKEALEEPEPREKSQRTESENAELFAELDADFAGYWRAMEAGGLDLIQEDGTKTKRLPETVLWLVDGTHYLGVIRIRHQLNDFLRMFGGHVGYDIRPTARGKGHGKKMLQLAMPYLADLGLTEVLITCDDDNIPSQRVIEAAGGVLEKTVELDFQPEPLRHYRVKVPC